MEKEEIHMGRRIRILTTRAPDGTWQASVTLPDHPEISVEPQAGASESEAHKAALSATITTVDRSRSKIGKP
jgi:hypothetical protein